MPKIVSIAAAAAALCVWGGVALAEACHRTDGSVPTDVHWQASGAAHPLIGKVLKDGKLVEVVSGSCDRNPLHQLTGEVWETIAQGGVVLLGEVHDNPEHHELRGDILWPRLKAVNQTGSLRPAAVFEHIRTTQQQQVEGFYAQAARSRRYWGAGDLLRVLDWKKSGWPEAEIFYPLFSDALRAKLPIIPGNSDRVRMRALVKDPSSASPEEASLLKLADALPDDLVEDLNAELEGSHCGVLPKTAIPAMSLAQRYTDAHLASAALTAAAKHGAAFVLAGNGHVRTDRGVPWHVRQLAPGKPVTAVMLIEVEEGKTDPAAYLAPEGRKPIADYIVFTPRQARPDPCEKMRRGGP